MGGAIGVQSTESIGSVFWVELNAAAVPCASCCTSKTTRQT